MDWCGRACSAVVAETPRRFASLDAARSAASASPGSFAAMRIMIVSAPVGSNPSSSMSAAFNMASATRAVMLKSGVSAKASQLFSERLDA